MHKFAHGDVILRAVKTIPKGAMKKAGGVLQEGEHTGHAHRLHPTTAVTAKGPGFQLFEKDGTLYAQINEVTALRHEEHREILLAPGSYKVGIIKEYDPFEKVVRNVVD